MNHLDIIINIKNLNTPSEQEYISYSKQAYLKSANFNDKEFESLFIHSNHKHFISNLSLTTIFLAKTNGNRYANNRPLPLDMTTKGPIVDIDISGCYENGLKNQEYPIERPVVLEYNRTSKINQYMSLRTFLSKYRNELVSSLWYLRVSTVDSLSFHQDYFYTWVPPIHIRDILNTDNDLIEDLEEELSNDSSHIYTREVKLAALQSDNLDWLENVCSRQEREEFLDKLEVIAAVFYSKSKRVKKHGNYESIIK